MKSDTAHILEEVGPWGDMPNAINTQSGRRVDLLDPQPDQIDIGDVARGLAFNSHYGGHTPYFFSIAEHSILVSKLMGGSMQGLLHDSAESYLSDISRPLKKHLPRYNEIEKRLKAVILKRFGVEDNDVYKLFDNMALSIEWDVFFPNDLNPFKKEIGFRYFPLEIHYYSPEIARVKFLEEFKRLTK